MKTKDRLLRLTQIIGDKKKGIEPIIPISRTSFYNGVADGIYPRPVKLSGGRTSAWRESEIMAVVAGTYRKVSAL